MATIGDLGPEVIKRVENRTGDLERAYEWIKNALIEIADDPELRDDFVELEVLGPTFDLTANTQEYEQENFLQADQECTAILDVMLWIDYPTNEIRTKLNPTHYQDADRSTNLAVSQPSEWYRFGSKIGFQPIPNQNYQTQVRYLRQHPIDDPVEDTEILLPRDWNEVIVMAAVERGFIELLEYEKSQAIHVLLHGDPNYPGKPGLIMAKHKKRKREAWRQQQPLRPVVRGYMYGKT